MKLRDVKELHTKTDDELTKQLRDARAAIAKLEIDSALKKVKNVAELKEIRKDIARVLTVMHARRLTGPKSAKVAGQEETVEETKTKKTVKKTKTKKE